MCAHARVYTVTDHYGLPECPRAAARRADSKRITMSCSFFFTSHATYAPAQHCIYIHTPRFDSAREIYARSSNLCSPAALNICCIALFCILYARRCVCVHLYIRGKSAVSTAPRGNGYIHLYKRQSATIRIANNFFF